jgi:hypothetical protein
MTRQPQVDIGPLTIENSRSQTQHTRYDSLTLEEWSARRRNIHTQHSTQRDIQAPGRIRTRNPSKRAAVDTHLRRRCVKSKFREQKNNKVISEKLTLSLCITQHTQ